MKKTICIIVASVLVFGLSISAFAETTGDIDVTGHIGTSGDPTIDPDADPDAPDSDYDLTFSTSVHWWVTQITYPNIVNGTASGPDSSVSNKIVNNSAADIDVSLVSFTGDSVAQSIASNLTLYLTGNLAADSMGTTNIAGDYTGPLAYTAPLAADSAWTYGFSGQYTAGSVNTSYTPAYVMTLGFEF